MRLFHYRGCSTCRNAAKLLRDLGADHETVDIVASPPSVETLRSLHERSGLPLRRFFNVAGRSYRGGNFKERLPGMSEAEAFDALAADGKLIKRPILDLGGTVLVGFKEEAWRAALGNS
jgi:arsenate reductase